MTHQPTPVWVLVIIVAAMLGLAVYGYMTGAWDQPP
jgi:hypothetical protein